MLTIAEYLRCSQVDLRDRLPSILTSSDVARWQKVVDPIAHPLVAEERVQTVLSAQWRYGGCSYGGGGLRALNTWIELRHVHRRCEQECGGGRRRGSY
jgi:hypothetical protein